MKYLLAFIFLAFIVGLRSADKSKTRAWPFVVLAFALGLGFFSLAVIG